MWACRVQVGMVAGMGIVQAGSLGVHRFWVSLNRGFGECAWIANFAAR